MVALTDPAISPSSSPGRILLAAENAIESVGLRVALEQQGHQVVEAWDRPHLLEELEGQTPDLLILDERLPDASGLEVVQEIRRRPQYADLAIMLLVPAGSGPQQRLASLRVGADDCLTRPFDSVELQLRVRALLVRRAPAKPDQARPRGTLVAVFNLRGGVGCTTLAVNLALALEREAERVALVDMDLARGEVAVALDLPTARTLVDLPDQELADLTPTRLRRLGSPYTAGLAVFPARGSPQEAEEHSRRLAAALSPPLRQAFDYVVFDLPSDLREGTLDLLDEADQLVVPLAPEVASIHTTARLLEIFDDLGYEKPIHLVCNRPFRSGLRRRQVELGLGRKLAADLPYAAEVPQVAARGRTLLEELPQSGAVAPLHRLARQIREGREKAQPETEPEPVVPAPPLPSAVEEPSEEKGFSLPLRIWLPSLALLALLAVLLVLMGSTLMKGEPATLQPGDEAPHFALPLVGGGTFSLADTEGTVRVLTFWHTQDALNRHQAVILSWGHETYSPQGVTVLAINPRDDVGAVVGFFQDASAVPGLDAPFPVALDVGGKVAARYGVQELPTTFIVNAGGEIVIRHEGLMTQRRLIEALEGLPAP